MREILFRGKRTDNGEWVEGGFHKHIKRTPCPIGDSLEDDDIAYLIIESGFSDWNMPKPLFSYQVDPETVGQYTGIKDKNGNRIFEGSIVRIDGFIYHVEFRYGEWEFRILSKKVYCFPNFYSHADECEIIGNAHDNPELLEVQNV